MRLELHVIPNSIFRTNLEITDEAESIEVQNIIKVEQKEDVIMEVDITDLLEKDTTMQENINEILLNTETPISSSIRIQTLIASSSRGTQTSLSLSARSSRKVHLHREIQKYKKQITALELTRYEEKKEDMSILFQQLDKFCPKEMSDFMKQQARLL